METRNAVIKSALITNADHGLLSIWLRLDYGGTQQGFGGYALGKNPNNAEFNIRNEHNYLGVWIWKIMDVCGVSDWNDIVGKPIRVECEHEKVYAIGHYIEDIWFTPKDLENI